MATVSDGRALVRAVAECKPHLIIVDVSMPLLNGLDAGQQAKELMPSVKLVFLTMNHDATWLPKLSHQVLVKTCAASELPSVRGATRKVLPLADNRQRTVWDFILRQDKKLIDEAE